MDGYARSIFRRISIGWWSIRALEDGTKELVALKDGVRDSKLFWKDMRLEVNSNLVDIIIQRLWLFNLYVLSTEIIGQAVSRS